jgi:hypothetical protein
MEKGAVRLGKNVFASFDGRFLYIWESDGIIRNY